MGFPPLSYLNSASIVTSASVVAGLSSIIFAAHSHLAWAYSAIFIAIVCDHFDGIIARRLHQSSDFGAQLDSLADALSFCAAPALITWFSGYQSLLMIFVLPVFTLCGIWRLAVFNISGLDESGTTPGYVGLPTTNAAVWWLFVVAILSAADFPPYIASTVWIVFFVVVAILMVSSIRFPKRGLYMTVHVVCLPLAMIAIWVTH